MTREVVSLDELAVKIKRLERRSSAFAVVALFFFMILGSVVLASAGGSEVRLVRTESLILVDAEGNRRGVLGVDKNGAFLTLLGKDGKERAALRESGERSFLAVTDSKGRSQQFEPSE